MQNLLTVLRDKTSSIHQALHHHPILEACQRNALDKAGYVRMLLAFYTPWKRLVPALDTMNIPFLKPSLENRYEAIRQDLTQMGIDNALLSNEVNAPLSEGQAIGVSYVLIGSSMGAKQLANHVLSTIENAPCAYLSISPKDAGWPLMADYLKNTASDKYPGAPSAAIDAFEMIRSVLSRPVLHEPLNL